MMDQMWQQAWDWGLVFITWLQTTYPQLESFFFFVTDLGREEFYLLVFPLIFWCIHKQLGKQLGYLFLFTVFVNAIFKQAFRGPRPFWVDQTAGLDTREEGYGIPSGHTQNATVFYFFLAAWVSRTWFWVAAIIMVLLMALSRIYLGVHFIHDTVAGFLLAALTLVGFVVIERRWGSSFNKRILGQRLLVMILIPFMMGVSFILIRWLIGAPDTAVPWASYIPAAEESSISAAAQAFGLLLGFGVGIVLENSRVRFRSDGIWWKRVVRYLIGIVVLVAIWAGLRQVFPSDPIAVAIPFRILRYFLVVIWAAYYAPWLFVKLKLADADPVPAIDVSLRHGG
ncbi:MAG: phosphatase PAP2 family protein [Ardenticatenaceae bacterium]|nr:phosphatase PAP2 family protein [Ardenticatenaceae bacterium]MBL1127737.1 phosphatase PAP2 family protein [Chloroflexota bacterium]